MREGFTIWFTGLSGVGKSTIAEELIRRLQSRGEKSVELLDGDVVRTHLSKGLGFSKEDRDTNILRIGFVCDLLSRNGVIAIAAAISPYREVRDRVRGQVKRFVEVYVSAPIECLVERDVKGLYKKAIAGEVKNFTGISDPYEKPLSPEVILWTSQETVDLSVRKLLRALELLGLIVPSGEPLPAEEENNVVLQLEKTGALDAPQGVSPLPAAKKTPEAILPHGGELVDRFLEGNERDHFIDRIEKYHSVTLTSRQWSDVELIATGAYSPLTGFVDAAEYRSIISRGRLTSGLAWTIPILLQVQEEEAEGVKVADDVVLRDRQGKNLAILHVSDIFRVDKEELAKAVWQSTDEAHPGVRALYEEGTVALAGPIHVLRLEPSTLFADHRLTPKQTRAAFKEKGWNSVVAFQTRNPIHRAHEYIQKAAMELVDGLLLHPLVGDTKEDDIPAVVRMECYDVLLKNYYPQNRVLLSVMPAAMRYAGPKEAIHHAIIRQNYGCTHFIVGRDHAGVGNYYGTYDAQKIFDGYTKEELGIIPLKFEHTFYCRKCLSMVSERTCPHGTEERVILSGTKVRERLQSGADLPAEFSRPEVVTVLRKHYRARKKSAAALSFYL